MVRQVEKARMEEWREKKETYNIIRRGNAFSAKAYTQTITV